mgnify:FL=1
MATSSSASESWFAALRVQAQDHAVAAWGLALSALGVAALLAQSVAQIAAGEAAVALRYALLGGGAVFAATALGALPALLLRRLPARVEDTMLGAAAGMMLAASAFSLLLPGLAAGADIVGGKVAGAAVVVVGMALGVLLMLGLDAFTPHEHERSGPHGPDSARLGRVWLFVFAITLHKLPEGMAIGVGFAHADLSIGLPLAAAIALQAVPEGLAVALALRSAGQSPAAAVLLAGATGLMEPLGAVLGVGLASGLAVAYPIGLGLAAGAMIFVVSHEVIPETHRNGHQTPATLGLMTGFALMMVLDTALG